jgi:hypothetical protein
MKKSTFINKTSSSTRIPNSSKLEISVTPDLGMLR